MERRQIKDNTKFSCLEDLLRVVRVIDWWRKTHVIRFVPLITQTLEGIIVLKVKMLEVNMMTLSMAGNADTVWK